MMVRITKGGAGPCRLTWHVVDSSPVGVVDRGAVMNTEYAALAAQQTNSAVEADPS